jgi:6-phosphogluconate dehydrogenase
MAVSGNQRRSLFKGMAVHNGIETAEFMLVSGAYTFTVDAKGVTAVISDGYISTAEINFQ